MPTYSCLPSEIRFVLEGLRKEFHWQHFLIFSWLVFLQMLNYGTGSLMGLNRMTTALNYDQMTRFLRAQYLEPQVWVHWLAQQVLNQLPPPGDFVLKLVVDGTWKGKRGKQIPGLAKGKSRSNGPWILGLQILVVCYQWNSYRIPVAFALIHNKESETYKRPNQVLRELLTSIPIPTWAKQVVILADAGFAAKENFRLFQKWNWGYVVRLPRSWKLADGRKLKNIIENTVEFTRTWIPSVNGKHRNTYHYHYLRAKLDHLGDVNLVITKKRRNDGPKAVRVLVTNLPIGGKTILALYQCRWYIEVLFKELKGTVALGQHQVNSEFNQVECSLGISLAAYLLLLRLNVKSLPSKGSWSTFMLKRLSHQYFTEKLYSHSIQKEVKKQMKLRLSA